MLDAAGLNDLRASPGDRLEALTRGRLSQLGLLIDSHWRLCFVWTSTGPTDVEICDYH